MSALSDGETIDAPGCRGRRIAALAALAVVTLAAAYLRTPHLGESLWLDELHTAWTADGTLAEVAPRARDGNQSPLYFYLVWGLARMFGMSEFVVRLPSFVAGILLVPAAYWVVVRWTASRAAGLLAALLIGIDLTCLFYASEGRPYALVQLAALAHVYALAQLVLAEREPPAARPLGRQRAAFVLGGALLFHLHYTAALLLAAELAAYGLIWPWRRRRMAYGAGRLAVDLGVLVFACLPAAPHLLEVAARRENWRDVIPQAPLSASALWFPLMYAVVWPGMLLAIAVGVRRLFDRRPMIGRVSIPLLVVAVCWETVPAALAWIATHTDLARLFYLRYLNVSVPAAPAMAGLLAGWTEGRFARLLQLGVIGAAAIFVYGANIAQVYEKSGQFAFHSNEDWRGAVEYINDRNEQGGRPVLVYANLIECRQPSQAAERQAGYCVFPVTGIYKVRGNELPPIAFPANGRVRFAHQQAAQIRSSGGVWLVVRNPPDQTAPILRETITAVADTGIPPERIAWSEPRRFGYVTVYRIDCPTR